MREFRFIFVCSRLFFGNEKMATIKCDAGRTLNGEKKSSNRDTVQKKSLALWGCVCVCILGAKENRFALIASISIRNTGIGWERERMAHRHDIPTHNR